MKSLSFIIAIFCFCNFTLQGQHQDQDYNKIEKYLNKRKYDKALESANQLLDTMDKYQLAGAYFWLGEINRTVYYQKVQEIKLNEKDNYEALSQYLMAAIYSYQQSWLQRDNHYSISSAKAILEMEGFLEIVANRYLEMKAWPRYAVNIKRARICNEFANEQGFAPLDTMLIFAEARAAELTNKHDEAARIYRLVTQLAPEDPDVYTKASEYYLSQGDTLKAVAHLDHATKRFPSSYEIYKLHIETLQQLGFFKKALSRITAGFENFPERETELYFLKGVCCNKAYNWYTDERKLTYFSLAEKAYQTAYKKAPGNYEYITALAGLYYKHSGLLSQQDTPDDPVLLEEIIRKSKIAARVAVAVQKNDNSEDIMTTLEALQRKDTPFDKKNEE